MEKYHSVILFEYNIHAVNVHISLGLYKTDFVKNIHSTGLNSCMSLIQNILGWSMNRTWIKFIRAVNHLVICQIILIIMYNFLSPWIFKTAYEFHS